MKKRILTWLLAISMLGSLLTVHLHFQRVSVLS